MDEDSAGRLNRAEASIDALQKGHAEIMGALGELRGELRAILPELRSGHADLAERIEGVRATYLPREEVTVLVRPLEEGQAQLTERVSALEPQVVQHAQRLARLETTSATREEDERQRSLQDRGLQWQWVPWLIAALALMVDALGVWTRTGH